MNNENQLLTLVPPADVKVLSISPTEAQITWKTNDERNIYCVYRATNENGPFSQVYEGVETYFTDSGLDSNTIYYYRVATKYEERLSELSSIVSTMNTNESKSLLAPMNLLSHQIRCQAVRLTWLEVAHSVGYHVYRSMNLNGSFTLIGTTNNPSFVDPTGTNGLTYYYRVAAFNASGEGPLSDVVSITITNGNSCQIKTRVVNQNGRLYRCYYLMGNICN